MKTRTLVLVFLCGSSLLSEGCQYVLGNPDPGEGPFPNEIPCQWAGYDHTSTCPPPSYQVDPGYPNYQSGQAEVWVTTKNGDNSTLPWDTFAASVGPKAYENGYVDAFLDIWNSDAASEAAQAIATFFPYDPSRPVGVSNTPALLSFPADATITLLPGKVGDGIRTFTNPATAYPIEIVSVGEGFPTFTGASVVFDGNSSSVTRVYPPEGQVLDSPFQGSVGCAYSYSVYVIINLALRIRSAQYMTKFTFHDTDSATPQDCCSVILSRYQLDFSASQVTETAAKDGLLYTLADKTRDMYGTYPVDSNGNLVPSPRNADGTINCPSTVCAPQVGSAIDRTKISTLSEIDFTNPWTVLTVPAGP